MVITEQMKINKKQSGSWYLRCGDRGWVVCIQLIRETQELTNEYYTDFGTDNPRIFPNDTSLIME